MADADPVSPDRSSPESFEGEDDAANQESSGQWQAHGQAPSSSPSQQTRPVPPMQKRRRVTRACDECRRKKIKCDGKQPCTHCTVYSYDCTYDQPSNRRRNPAPQYIEALETRLQRAETLLRTFIPNFDIKDPDLDSLIRQRQARAAQESRKAEPQASNLPADDDRGESVQDGQLRSMIESTGQLDLDERGEWDFHGGSSGAVFLRRMREQFGGLLGPDSKTPFLPRPPRYMTATFESPRSSESPFDTGLPNTLNLPPRATARKMCDLALNRCCCLLRFVHAPTFFESFNRIYDTPPEDFKDADHRFLAMLYIVIALGGMFTEKSQESLDIEQAGYKASIEQGVKYFKAGRQMLDVTECRDIISLQAILFMILFLQVTSNLSTCYSYIGVALRCAVRMGMHRNLSGNFNLIEREVRRRVFWVIRKMDTYVSALLGFPRMLSDDDIDQEYPIEVDDEFITEESILPMPAGKISLVVASNAQTRLMAILYKVINYVYPIRGVEQSTQSTSSPSYVISHAKIREIEVDLKDWLDQLPMALRPGGDAPEEFVRVQQLLRMAYAHVQMMLYRPFLHYVSSRYLRGKSLNDRSYACAAACVSVSRNIIHIIAEMRRRGVLLGGYWFTMYTTFFAILSLVYFVLENPDKPGSQEILAEATAGKNALRDYAKTSLGADRCNAALNVGVSQPKLIVDADQRKVLFEKLPEKLKRNQIDPILSRKKRSASSLNHVAANQASSNLETAHPRPVAANGQRATTFPFQLNTATSSRQSPTFDTSRYPYGRGSDPQIRRSFHELVSPADTSATGTPDSAKSGSSVQAPFDMQQSYGENNFIPELGAMMFSSADPFAYPNQPMIDFENCHVKQEFVGNMMDTSVPNMYLSNTATNVSSPYDNIEGQLFGPLPPYLMQNQAAMDMSQMNMTMPRLNPLDIRPQSGLTPGVGVNFEEIFAEGNDEWNNMLADQGYLQ